MSLEAVWKMFTSPGMAYRGKPFWSWNGKLRKDELLRQVHVLKAMGFGGFFMHSRVGLATEYLGDEWFELINACIQEAEKLGMEAWLYDEDRWPSGIAGGQVTCDPQYRGRYLLLEVKDADDWSALDWSREVVAVFLARVDGVAFWDCERVQQGSAIRAGERRALLVFRVVEAPKSGFYNGYTYADLMNPATVERFIEVTHEAYKERCGEYFGKTLHGIFTDEPHRGALMDGFCINEPDAQWRAPWTAGLPARFERDFGYDLIERLPDVFLQREGKAVSQVKWHYVEALCRLFLDSFAKPINEWCKANNLILTGHYLHEDSLTAQTAMAGSMMRFYEHMGYPGVDVLTERNSCHWIVKQMISVARQLGQEWRLSELYGCTSWQMPFAGHRATGDWQALLGINLRCHHLSWYTMEGEAKRDFPASIAHQSAWWTAYDAVETYFARVGVLMSQGRAVSDLLVVYPVESVWCQVYAGWSRWLGCQEPAIKDLEEAHANLFRWLVGAQLDFDYGDEDLLSRLAAVIDEQGQPRFQVGQARYKAVLVGGMVTMRDSTLALLKAFADAGGTVVFAGAPPAYVNAVESSEATSLAERCTRVDFAKAPLLEVCDRVLGGYGVRVFGQDGQILQGVYAGVRESDDCRTIMLLNTDRDKGIEFARVRVRGEGTLEKWDCLRGTRTIVPARATGDGFMEFDETFAAGDSHVYCLLPAEASALPPAAPAVEAPRVVERHACPGPFRFRMTEPNVCVLDFARYQLGEDAWRGPMEILKADRAIRRHLGMGFRDGEMLQPWFTALHGSGDTPEVPVVFRFTFNVDVLPSGPVDLALESPDSYTIRLNGETLDPATSSGWWVDRAIARLPLPPQTLRLGENVVELVTTFRYETNPEALYLLGDFGVRVKGTQRTLCARPAKLRVGDLSRQRLPFYGGCVLYEVPVLRPAYEGERLILSTGAFGGACVRVHGNGKTVVIPWAPYEADVTELACESGGTLLVEVLLTRRNTFGPLHEYPVTTDGTGPGNFTAEGRRFRENYVLLPTGLLTAPELRVVKP